MFRIADKMTDAECNVTIIIGSPSISKCDPLCSLGTHVSFLSKTDDSGTYLHSWTPFGLLVRDDMEGRIDSRAHPTEFRSEFVEIRRGCLVFIYHKILDKLLIQISFDHGHQLGLSQAQIGDSKQNETICTQHYLVELRSLVEVTPRSRMGSPQGRSFSL
jgi:hypothetical protein